MADEEIIESDETFDGSEVFDGAQILDDLSEYELVPLSQIEREKREAELAMYPWKGLDDSIDKSQDSLIKLPPILNAKLKYRVSVFHD
jgi:hypothetical protein